MFSSHVPQQVCKRSSQAMPMVGRESWSSRGTTQSNHNGKIMMEWWWRWPRTFTMAIKPLDWVGADRITMHQGMGEKSNMKSSSYFVSAHLGGGGVEQTWQDNCKATQHVRQDRYKRQRSRLPDNIRVSRFQTVESEFHPNQTHSALIRLHSFSLCGKQHVTKTHAIQTCYQNTL